MAPHLGLQRIMIPSAQVSSLTTGSITLPSARGAFVSSAFESIATAMGDGSSFELTFSSIPSTYQHLQIRCFLNASNNSVAINIRLNGDSSSIYTRHRLIGTGSASTSVTGTSLPQIPALGNAGLPTTSLTYGVAIIDILDYRNTSKYKTVRYAAGQNSNAGGGGVDYGSGLWPSVSAVTSVTIKTDNSGAPFTTASHVALYGIKGA